jgi:hypothetical protein
MWRSKLRNLAIGVSIPLLATAPVLAQATRTWVSGVGDDVNPCSRTAPCKTFAGAISKTAAGGEIDVLDPGGFGTVTITKSITIDGRGTMASILASGTNGININAGVADTIILRNLSINGAGTTLGLNGINYLAGANVTIEDCVIENFSQNGISIAPSTANAMTVIRNVTFDGSPVGVGVSTANAAGTVTATIVGSSFRAGNNTLSTTGLSVTVPSGQPGATVAVTNSDFSDFLNALSNTGTGANLTVDHSLIKRSMTGVNTSGSAITALVANTFVQNVTAFTTNGNVTSTGNNAIIGTGAVPTANGTIPQK